MIPLKISFKNYSNRFPDILPTFFLIPKQIRPFIIEPEASLLGLFILKNTGKMSQKIYSNLFSNFVSKIRQSYVIVTKCSHLFHERNKGHYKTQSSRGFLTGCVESLNLPSFYYLCILIYLSQKPLIFLNVTCQTKKGFPFLPKKLIPSKFCEFLLFKWLRRASKS